MQFDTREVDAFIASTLLLFFPFIQSLYRKSCKHYFRNHLVCTNKSVIPEFTDHIPLMLLWWPERYANT